MPPKTVIHPSKKEAVFQLCNFLCTSSVEKLSDLANGKILLETIQTKFSLISNDGSTTEEHVKTSKNKVDILQDKEEPGDVDLKNENETNFNPAKEDDDILLRFNCIQKFIDDHYEINSETLISYDECRKSSELELIKVTLFVLSQIIKHLYDINNEQLQTLYHFDIKFQIELEDIFKVFITEREKLTKNEIENILSKSAKKASPTVTPRRTSLRRTSLKEQKSVSPLGFSSVPNEDVFTNSPLKIYFESPIFKKEDILQKNKIIQDMEKVMYAEDEAQQQLISEMEKKLKKKDKDYKQLEKQNRRLLKEIEDAKSSYGSLSSNYEKLLKENNDNRQHFVNRVMELTTELAEVKKNLEEKEKNEELNSIESRKSFSESLNNSSLKSPTKKIDALKIEVAVLKESMKSMELKIHAYKKQLRDKIVTELKEKKSAGNLNQSYEEVWNELYKRRKGEEENMASIIEEDNRNLNSRLSEANSVIQNLNKEIEALKNELRENRKPNQRNRFKNVSSVATARKNLNLPEFSDSSKIPESEILRKSLNNSKDIEHNHLSDESYCVSDYSSNSIPRAQSIISSESEPPILCPEKSSEAILWKMYDIQKPETDSTSGINLNHDSIASEISHIDTINDLEVNNINVENVAPGDLVSQEYVLGNLNFDMFLNELKKLTKNGSFQKVLQVFGKQQNEINGTNRSDRLDLQELLKMITECMCVAVSSNAEFSNTNLQDKCCSTDENNSRSINQNMDDIDKLKNELSAASEKYEIEINQFKEKFKELQKDKELMTLKCQAYDQTISQKNKTIENVVRRYQEQKIKIENMAKKCNEYKESYHKSLAINRREFMTHDAMKKRAVELYKNLRRCENMYKLSKEEINRLKQELQELKEEREKLLKEKEKLLKENERKSVVSAEYSRNAFPSRESYVGNHLGIKSEFHSNTFRDTDNESLLSNVFHKSISHYVSENEDDFFDYNSLDSIKKEYDDDRVEELKRRNSLYPFHLQSSYPLEADLKTTHTSLYMKNEEKVKEEERCSKKRKFADVQLEMPSGEVSKTPVRKVKREFETPPSLVKLLKLKARPNYCTSPKPRKKK